MNLVELLLKGSRSKHFEEFDIRGGVEVISAALVNNNLLDIKMLVLSFFLILEINFFHINKKHLMFEKLSLF